MATRIRASYRGGELTHETLVGYGLTADDVGRWAVVQIACACLGTGDTEAEALADAEQCCGEDVVPEADPLRIGAGSVVCVEICAE